MNFPKRLVAFFFINLITQQNALGELIKINADMSDELIHSVCDSKARSEALNDFLASSSAAGLEIKLEDYYVEEVVVTKLPPVVSEVFPEDRPLAVFALSALIKSIRQPNDSAIELEYFCHECNRSIEPLIVSREADNAAACAQTPKEEI